MDDGGDVAAVDVAVTFFASVLMLFVFIAFNLRETPPQPDLPTAGPAEPTVTAVVPAWEPVARRSGFAILSGATVSLLDLAAMARGFRDPGGTVNTAANYLSFEHVAGLAPSAFRLDVRFTPDALPAEWLRSRHDLGHDAACPELDTAVLTVWVDPRGGAVGEAGAWTRRCGLRARFEVLRKPAASGRFRRIIERRPGSFTAESMFR